MADDINKKITIDVQVNSDVQEQITALGNLQTAAGSAGAAIAAALKAAKSANTQMATPPSENPFKKLLQQYIELLQKDAKKHS